MCVAECAIGVNVCTAVVGLAVRMPKCGVLGSLMSEASGS